MLRGDADMSFAISGGMLQCRKTENIGSWERRRTMRIEIAGGGAIGLSWAARLASAGARVRVWTRTAEQADKLREAGIVWRNGSEERHAAVEAAAAERDAAYAAALEPGSAAGRWIVLAFKSYHLDDPDALPFIAALAGAGETPVVCLQNGIGHMEKLRTAMPHVPLAQAVTAEGALREDGRTVRLTGQGAVMIETLDAHYTDRQKMFIDLLNKAGIAASLSKNILTPVYGKLLVNCVINPLTGLLGVRNGELPEDPVRLRLMRAVHAEALAVLSASGYTPDGREWERLLDVCRRTAGNRSSMLADIEAGRPTEIEAINGGIVRMARKSGLAAPLNEALAALIGAIGSR